jgi:hypothetical protein
MESLAETEDRIIGHLPPGFQVGDLPNEHFRVEHDTVTDDAPLPLVQDAGRDQVQDNLLLPDHEGMARIVPTLITDDIVRMFGIDVYDLAFALVTPLGSDDDYVSHGSLLV